jgi:hypothetical protein
LTAARKKPSAQPDVVRQTKAGERRPQMKIEYVQRPTVGALERGVEDGTFPFHRRRARGRGCRGIEVVCDRSDKIVPVLAVRVDL